jgi:hypothetical protein
VVDEGVEVNLLDAAESEITVVGKRAQVMKMKGDAAQ